MPANSSDEKKKPQPFSVDEMMHRLKSPVEQSGGSRVVSREVVDGEVVEVVRKRKRRTHQPKKQREMRRGRMRRFALFVVLPAGLLFVALVATILIRYQSEGYRDDLSGRVSEIVGAQTKFRRLKVKGFSASTAGVVVTGNTGSILESAKFSTLTADLALSSFFTSEWLVETLMIQSVDVVLHPPEPTVAGRAPTPDPAAPLRAGIGLSATPRAIDIGALRVTACDLVWDDESPETAPVTFVDSALVTTTSVGENMDLDVRGGQITIPGWPEMDIENASVALEGAVVKIDGLSLNRRNYDDEFGVASARGEVPLNLGGVANVVVDMEGMELRGMVHEEWQDQVRGKVTAQLRFKAVAGESGSLQAEGPFEIADAVIGDLSALNRISTYTGEAQLARLTFDSLSGNYRKSALGTDITDIKAEMSGILKVRGSLHATQDGRITATLDVGLAEALLTRTATAKPEFFGPANDGFCWTKVQIRGDDGEIEDDLSARYERLAGVRALTTFPLPPEGTNATSPAPPKPGETETPAPDKNSSLEATFNKLIGED